MAWFSRLKKKVMARRNAMERISKKLDMQFRAKETFSSVPLLKDFHLFRTNYKKGVSNILSRSNESDDEHYKIFDYKYVIQAGNTPVVFQQTVLFIESKDFNIPKFYFYPKGKTARWFYKIGFFSPKKTTANERFNKNYIIKKTNLDDSRINSITNNSFLELINQNDGIHVEGNNFHFIIYYHGKLLEGQEVNKLFQTGLQFIQHINDAN